MKPKTSSVKFFLVCEFGISNKEAQGWIDEGRVLLNGKIPEPKTRIIDSDELMLDEKIIKPKFIYRYFLYYKPVGVECTMNPNISNNLLQATGLSSDFFPLGRLDKDSEGLVLMTNDGKLYQNTVNPSNKVEKVYEVEVDKAISNEFLNRMSSGVEILGKRTEPCKIVAMGEKQFKITLTQGMNRQIRRMCHKLGFSVLRLKRIKFGEFDLEGVSEGGLHEVFVFSNEKQK